MVAPIAGWETPHTPRRFAAGKGTLEAFLESYSEGHARSRDEQSRAEAYAEGYSEAFLESYSEGHARSRDEQSRAEAYAEGYSEGYARMRTPVSRPTTKDSARALPKGMTRAGRRRLPRSLRHVNATTSATAVACRTRSSAVSSPSSTQRGWTELGPLPGAQSACQAIVYYGFHIHG